MTQCPNGHIYDESKSRICPICSGGSQPGNTIPLNSMTPQNYGATAPAGNVQGLPNTQPVVENKPNIESPGVTNIIGGNKNEKDDKGKTLRAVVGWLVCVEGKKRGQDYRVVPAYCHIGRSKSMDICLDFDKTISDNAMTIAYNERKNTFTANLETSTNAVYLNDDMLGTAQVPLNDNDLITLGETVFVFRTLCNDKFTWKKSEATSNPEA